MRQRNRREQTKASNVTRRTLAIFITAGTRRGLKPCEIAKRMNADYDAVYSAIRRFCKYGFLRRVSKGFGKSFYLLANREAALEYLDSNVAVLGGEPSLCARALDQPGNRSKRG